MRDINIPVITVDGPGGVGKGTLSTKLADYLGWHFLDSGAIYRLLALVVINKKINPEDLVSLEKQAHELDIYFKNSQVFLEGQEVTELIRTQQCGQVASQIACFPEVRLALLDRQRLFKVAPGLVADGRDMATVVFPDAILKLFLSASPDARAERRHKQLKEKGINVSLERLVQELVERDQRDMSRSVAPLVAAADSIIIDSTELSKEEVFSKVLKILEKIKY